jgi:hypothetical protein
MASISRLQGEWYIITQTYCHNKLQVQWAVRGPLIVFGLDPLERTLLAGDLQQIML